MKSFLKLLLIEDNRSIAAALSETLRDTYTVEVAISGKQGILQCDTDTYDIIVLDLNLPDVSGLHVCQQLRGRGVSVPILILSAEKAILTKIKLLDAGANDYLTKPFSLGELKARLRCLLRQSDTRTKASGQLEVSGLVLNTVSREVSRDGVRLNLRRKEFALLECLMAQAGTVVSRESLTRYAWGSTETPWTNTVDVHIKHLRDKVDRPFNVAMIQTVHGVGYRLVPASVPILESALQPRN